MALDIEQRIRLVTGLSAEIEQLLAACLPAEPNSAGARVTRLVSSLRQNLSALYQDCGACASAHRDQERQQFARFADHAPGFFYTLVKTADGRWFMPFASAGIVETFGVYPEDVANDLDRINAVAHPDDLERLLTQSERSAQELSSFQLEYRIRHPRKGERWIELRSQPQMGADGSVIWHGFGHDVTLRKKVEFTLRFVAQRDGMSDADEFLAALARHLGAALNVDYVVIDRLAGEGVAETVALFAKGQVVPNMRYALRDTPCDNVMGKNLCCYRNNVQACFPADELLVQMGVDSYLGIPLWDSAGQAIGLIAIMDGEPLADPAMAEQLLQVVAPAVAAILERQRSEGARQESERNFRALAENMPDHVARWDLDLRYVYLNPAQERLLGKPAAELIGTEIEAFTPERRLYEALRRVSTSGQPMTLVVNLPMDETRRHEIRLIPERNVQGAVVGVLGIGRDVTEQLQMQEAMQASERQYRHLVENLPDHVARWDSQGRILYMNPVSEVSMGRPLSEYLGRTISDQLAAIREAIQEVVATGVPVLDVRQSYLDQRTQQERIHQVSLIPERDSAGKVVSVLGIGRDITELVCMQQVALHREQQFRSLAENLPDNVARWDTQGHLVYLNSRFARMLGVEAEEVIGTSFGSDSFPQLHREVERLVSEPSAVAVTHQVRFEGDDHPVIQEVRFVPERNAAGATISVLGIGRDVTEQLRIQEALMASERQYRSLTENLPNMVARYDREARIVYFSPKLEQHLNCSAAQVLGRTPNECWPDGRFSAYQALLLQVARTGEQTEMEVSAMDVELGLRQYLLQFVAERDEQGQIASVLVISHDITERRRTEADTRMAASVFDAAGEGIAITDPAGRILKVNRAFTSICGYAQEEVVGKDLLLVDKAFHEEAFYADIWNRVRQNGGWDGELECGRRNGDPYTKRLSISCVRDDQGRLLHYVGIFSDISQVKRHEIQLRYIAHHDTLTGLPNRILLMDRLQLGIAQARRSGKILGVLFIDLDGFKPINDRLGHKAGDQTLIEMGQRMINILRAGDTIARLGGDEFVVLLPGLSDADECESSTRRLLQVIGEPLDLSGTRCTLSASIGISLFPRDADDADSLLRRADEAMYVAKRTGRSQYVFCSHADGVRVDGNSVHELRAALAQDQIEVHFQPIVDLCSGRVTKAEALVRWRHPERGLVPPGEFIPLAESTGLIHAIGTRVFSRAVATVLTWNRLCPAATPHRISVNRSPREFMSPDGVASWLSVLQGQEDAAQMLSVEITEGLLLDDQPKVLAQLQQLRALGMTIALDDFGTGFSSLAYLKKFDIDYLKIDRSFVLDIVEDPSDRVIVESVIAMARHLGIRLIAEGVETSAQAALLVASRCDYAQGYLYARPLPEQEFLEFVQAAERRPLELPSPAAEAA